MTDASSGAAQTAQSTTDAAGIDPFTDAGQRGLAAIADTQNHLMRHLSDVNAETLQFMDRRMRHDWDTAIGLAGCTSPQDVATVCASFYETALAQYLEQLARLTAIYTETTCEAAADTQHQLEETAAPADA